MLEIRHFRVQSSHTSDRFRSKKTALGQPHRMRIHRGLEHHVWTEIGFEIPRFLPFPNHCEPTKKRWSFVFHTSSSEMIA